MSCITRLPQIDSSVLKRSDIVLNEIPSGILNGVNTFFSTTNKYESSTLEIYLDGRKLSENDFSEGGDLQSFSLIIDASDFSRLSKPPCNDEELRVRYIKAIEKGCITNL